MLLQHQGLDWEEDGRAWPHRSASAFVQVQGTRWHVQRMGSGPPLLLVHGTGASTHSWRDLMPLLAARFSLLAPDLPGHGFSTAPSFSALSLPGMAGALRGLLRKLAFEPEIVVGHSAGAAILARLALDGGIAPRHLVAVNGALMPFAGFAGAIFPGLAKLLFLNPFAPRLVAWTAQDRARVERLIRDTGSTLGAEGLGYYARLFRAPGHVAGALGMMANWDLKPLVADLPRLAAALTLVVGDADKAVAPEQAEAVRRLLPAARIVTLDGLGHLAHEERPDLVAQIIAEVAGAAPATVEPPARARRAAGA